MNEKEGKFVIRVYGLIVNKNQEVLVSDEFQMGMKMTKFPGGGLNYGEGPVDCLRREISEECNRQEIMNIEHFYTTDFFQEALFYPNHQLISIYYLAELAGESRIRISKRSFDFEVMENGKQSFRWMPVFEIHPDEFSFPIDKFVADKLKRTYLEKN